MGSQTRNQEYTYQYKSVSVVNQNFCGYGPNIQINLPDNILEVKDLYMRVVAQFDSTEVYKQIENINLNGLPTASYFYSGTIFTLPINWHANASNILDGRISLKGLLKRLYIYPGSAGNQPYIILSLGSSTTTYTVSNNNKLLLWKIDLTYTTQGIR